MTQLASDNFTRANSASLGANWSAVGGGGAANWGISSNTAIPANAVSGSDSANIYTGTSAPADQYSEMTVSSVSGNTLNDAGPGPMCRASTGVLSYYRAPFSVSNGWSLDKEVSGTFTTIAFATTGGCANGDVLRMEAQGTTIRLKQNGSLVTSQTDSALSSGGWGMYYSTSGVGGSNAAVSLWAGGDFSGGSTLHGLACAGAGN